MARVTKTTKTTKPAARGRKPASGRGIVSDRLIRNRTHLANALRGYAAEFGLTAAKGMAHLDPLLDRIQADESLPSLARKLFAIQAPEYA
jgi:transposase